MGVGARTVLPLFEGADDADLVEAVALSLSHLRKQSKSGPLRSDQLHAWYAWETAGRVSNGGIRCLLEAPDLHLVDRIEAIRAVGAEDAARALEAVASALATANVMESSGTRLAAYDKLAPPQRAALDALGWRLYDERLLPFVSDFVRARRELFADLPLVQPIIARSPKRKPPTAKTQSIDVALWLISLGAMVQFREARHANGRLELFFKPEQLPSGALTLAGFKLPSQRRDTDTTLQLLSSHEGVLQIEEISLEGCRVGIPGLASLGKFEHLTRLDLNRASVNDQSAKSAELGLPDLVTLELAETDITDLGLGYLAKSSHLRELDIAGTKVNGESLTRLLSLEELTISGDISGEADWKFLKPLSRLRKLIVRGGQLGGESIHSIASLGRLEVLQLFVESVPEEALLPLRANNKLQVLVRRGISGRR